MEGIMQNNSQTTEKYRLIDREAIEPRLIEIHLDKRERRKLGPYTPRRLQDVYEGVEAMLSSTGKNIHVDTVRRMGGGASKEQFVIDAVDLEAGQARRYVLRMDPREGILETCRRREAQVIAAVSGRIPVPEIVIMDDQGHFLQQPSMLTTFIAGTTKPTKVAEGGVSGTTISLSPEVASALAPQFMQYFAETHRTDLSTAELGDFAVPRPSTLDAALWQVNYWTRVRELDRHASSPLLALAEAWLYRNMPVCDNPVMIHGDYRVGNFLFDEESLQITAILDWELAHIGDFHEDIAYSLMRIFFRRGSDGNYRVGDMLTRQDFIDQYEEISGRSVNKQTLHWYRALNCYKLIVMNLTSGMVAANDGTNHQNVLLTSLAPIAAGFSQELCQLIAGDMI